MNNERPDQVTMIGLHKLAAQFGDGLVPELYELLLRRTSMIDDNPNITAFPAHQVRPPARTAFGLASAPRDNILPFPSGAVLRAPKTDRA